MATSDFIIDVNEADFEYEVIAYSHQTPVVVDFWAEWCAPCRTLGPMLERLAHAAQGEFRLAKLNIDENPNLALRFAVRSIPAVKAFRNGKMVAEFVGLQPEPRLREFLRSVAPSPSDLLLEKGNSLLEMQQGREAERCFRQALEMVDTPAARLGLAKSLLLQGKGQEADQILANFSPSREYATAEVLRPLASNLYRLEKGQVFASEDPLDAAFVNALRLVQRGNFEAAMDGLLDILRENKHYRQGEARRVIVAMLEVLTDAHPATAQYRRELASVLF